MQKVFFRNLIFLVAVNLVIKPFWIFGIDRTVQNTVGASSYGIYFVLTNLTLLTQILLDFGISNYNNRLIAQQEHLLSRQLSNIFSIKLLLTGFYLLVTLTIGYLLNYTGHVFYLLLLIGINQALASLIVYVRTNISALHHFRVDSMLSVLDKGLMIAVCSILLLVPALRSQFIIDWFIYAQLGAYLLTLAISLLYILSITGKISMNFSVSFSRELIAKAFPFALLIALMMLYARLDAVMLEKLLPEDGEKEAGLFASAFRILDAMNQFGYLFAVLLLPIFSRMLAQNKSIGNLAQASFTVIFIFSFIASLGLIFYARPVMELLYHEHTDYTASILQWLIPAFAGYCTVFIFGTLLTANGNLYSLCIVSAIAVVVNFSLNLWLIPHYKALGASQSATLTQMLIAALNLLVAYRVFKWKVNYRLMLKLLVFACLSLLLFRLGREVNMPWYATGMAAAILSLMIPFTLRIIDLRKLYAFLRFS